MIGRAAACALIACACGREPLTSCADDLTGVYESGAGRWMLLDEGDALEGYPIFKDGDALAAPRALALARDAEGRVAGSVHRRYAHGAAFCESRAAVRVTACSGAAVELVLSDLSPPTAYEPCTWPRPATSRVERWRRE